MKASENIIPSKPDVNSLSSNMSNGLVLVHIQDRLGLILNRINGTLSDQALSEHEKLRNVCAVTCAVICDLKSYMDQRLEKYTQALLSAIEEDEEPAPRKTQPKKQGRAV